MAIRIEDILKIAQSPAQLERKEVSDEWDMDTMLAAITQVGKLIEPRFVIDDVNREVYENLAYWLMNDARMSAKNPVTGEWIPGSPIKGIYLGGNTGTGKTTAMMIARKLYPNVIFNLKSSGSNVLYQWTEARAEEIASAYAQYGDIEKWKKTPLLCIQDLGSEPMEAINMGNRLRVLQSLLEYRGDRRDFVTMITSNLPMHPEAITRRYGDRVASRLMEMCNYLTLTGKDRRRL